MIKLVVCDIDGTLIGADEILDKRAVELVKRLRGKGIYFSLASGRSDYLAAYYANRLNLSIPYITCNGAVIVHNGRRISEKLIPAAPLYDLFHEAERMGFSIVYSQGGEESVWNDTNWIISSRLKYNRYHRIHKFTKEEWRTVMLDKVLILDEKNSGSISIMEKRCKLLAPDFTFTRYMDYSVEIVHGKVSKASGIITLAELLGISLEEVLAIGDHQNDIEMINAVGHGAAVGNATADLKAAADYVCGSERLSGVIEAVNYFCFSSSGVKRRVFS